MRFDHSLIREKLSPRQPSRMNRGWSSRLLLGFIVVATAPNYSAAVAQQAPRASLIRLPASALERTSFNQVSAAAVTTSGTLVLLDGGDSELREFTLRGDALKSFGRRGRGPGEFMRATELAALHGNRVAVHDVMLRRINVFGPGRTPDTTVSVECGVRCCLPDGAFLEGVTPQPSRADSTLYRFVLRSLQGVSRSPDLTLRTQPQRVAAVSRSSSSGHFEFSGVHTVPFSGTPFVLFTQRGIVSASAGYQKVDVGDHGFCHQHLSRHRSSSRHSSRCHDTCGGLCSGALSGAGT